MNNMNSQIQSLIKDCNEKYNKANKGSSLFKIINIISSVVIIIGGSIVTVDGFFSDTINYPQVVLGVIITVVKTISDSFSFVKKGILYKQLSIKFRKLSRKLMNLQQLNASEMDINNTLNRVYQEFDDLDLSLFSSEQLYLNHNEKNNDI